MTLAPTTYPCGHAPNCDCTPDERPCRHCGHTDLECDGPPTRCCDTCTHWTPLPHPADHTRTQR